MPETRDKIRTTAGLTLVEMVVAMAIMVIIFAAVVLPFRIVLNSWDSKAGAAETIQNGRILIDHLNHNLSKAVRITAVSASSVTNGYIQFVANDTNTYRYDIGESNYVEYGPVGSLSDLAGPVTQLQFSCYDACDLNTPVTNVNVIRVVKVDATITNSHSLGQDKTFTTSAYLRTNANTELVGCWKLDETSGLTAADSSRLGRYGTLTNMAGNEWTAAGLIGGALAFDGSNDYVSVSSLDAYLYFSSTFTVTGWFKTSQSTGMQTIVGQWCNFKPMSYVNLYFGWQVLVENNKVVARFGPAATSPVDITGTSDVNDGIWHHFALVYPTKNANAVLYVDGSSQGTPGNENFYPTYTKFRIGDGSYSYTPNGGTSDLKGGPFNGTIDNVRIYNRVLSADEVAEMANALRYRAFNDAKAAFDCNTSITISTPDTNEGDLLITAVATDGSTTISPPSGWTVINQGSDSSNQVTLGAWRKLAEASEPASHQFTWTGGQKAYGWMMCFTGHDPTNPINNFEADSDSNSTPTSPEVTTTVNNCLILRLGAFDDNDVNTLPEPGNPGLPGHTAITMDESSDSNGCGPVGWPVGWWKLDEISGLTAADSSGSGYNGTLTNMAGNEWTTGKINGALAFDGTNDYVAVSSLDTYLSFSSNFTVAGWFKTSQSTGMQTIVGQWCNFKPMSYVNLYFGWQVLVENNKVVARFGPAATSPVDITGTSTVNNGIWHHFALVYPTKNANAVLYVDGSSQGTPGTKDFQVAYTKFRIGDGSYSYTPNGGTSDLKGGPFNGTIDDVRIYNRVLSGEEIAQLAQWLGGSSGTVSGGAGYVSQATVGSSGTSNFSLGEPNESRMLTIAIAPANSNDYCCGDQLQP